MQFFCKRLAVSSFDANPFAKIFLSASFSAVRGRSCSLFSEGQQICGVRHRHVSSVPDLQSLLLQSADHGMGFSKTPSSNISFNVCAAAVVRASSDNVICSNVYPSGIFVRTVCIVAICSSI